MLRSKQPVDGARPYSPGAQTDELSAQCPVCFLRAAGWNVSRGPWLGEAGCPGFLRSSLAVCSVFSVLHFLSRGHQRHALPSDFWPSVLLPFRKSQFLWLTARIDFLRLKAALLHLLIRFLMHENEEWFHVQFSLHVSILFIMNQHAKSYALNIAYLLPSGLVCLRCRAVFILSLPP